MAADTAHLSKVDSAVSGLSSSPPETKGHRRTSSSVTGVFNIADLEKEGKELEIAKETQKLNWKLNSSTSQVEEPAALKKLLTTPPVKKIDLRFQTGLEVTARNLKGVTIKDALDAIHKQFKRRLGSLFGWVLYPSIADCKQQKDDELDLPVLAGFEWDKDESWTRLTIHLKKEGQQSGGGKKKKNQDQ